MRRGKKRKNLANAIANPPLRYKYCIPTGVSKMHKSEIANPQPLRHRELTLKTTGIAPQRTAHMSPHAYLCTVNILFCLGIRLDNYSLSCSSLTLESGG